MWNEDLVLPGGKRKCSKMQDLYFAILGMPCSWSKIYRDVAYIRSINHRNVLASWRKY
jgi:hypothetical protein